MPRPLLLIVDGESRRTPAFVSAMEKEGWLTQWIKAGEGSAFLAQNVAPDLMLMDSLKPGEAGVQLAHELRSRNPKLPVLVLTEGDTKADLPPSLPVQGFLERTQPDFKLAEALRPFMPHKDKLSSQDIFGDLLEDLEGHTLSSEPAPKPTSPPPTPAPVVSPLVAQDPFALFDEAQAPAITSGKLSSQDIFGDLIQEVEAAPAPRKELARPVEPMKIQSLPPKEAPKPPTPARGTEFTLSGIAGVNDPFAWDSEEEASHLSSYSGPPARLTPDPQPTPPTSSAAEAQPSSFQASSMVPAEVPGAQVLEEYGNYYLLEKIAVGGMAELFKAQQRGVQGFQKIVAIKRILPHLSDNEDFVTMFIDEAKLAAQLTHPNIAQIFDLGKAGSSYYIAMEYVSGRDVRTLLRKVREYGLPFPEPVAAFVTMKVAAALDYAHRKRGFDDRELKLVHRDISPQNVLLSSEGAVKLVDFGIAKAATKATQTMAGALKGKLLYMSPEQALGQPLDNRSDLYSLGLVLFEMLTGERCFQADSELGVLEKVRMGRVADVQSINPMISKDMVAIVQRALQKHVDHRYPSARLLERDLRELLMKQGHIPNEHEVAEYVEALLMGPKERVQNVMGSRFPYPTMPLSAIPEGVLDDDDDAPTTAEMLKKTQPRQASVPLPTPPEPMEVPSQKRPLWLLPAILALLALMSVLVWLSKGS
jgi:serine/threonine protein kinase/DNA-binding NarL/FixJ family response regulator